MKQAFISAHMQDMWSSANNCAPGCGCEDDRFEMTFERVAGWKASVGPEVSDEVLQDLKALVRPDSDSEVLLGLQLSTSLSFDDENEAKRWMEVWIHLLDGIEPRVDRSAIRGWLDSRPIDFKKNSQPGGPLLDLHIAPPGTLFGSTDGKTWTKLAPTPRNLKLSMDQAYRFEAAPGIFDEELDSLTCLKEEPGIVDLRLECHSLTDKVIDTILRLPTLQVLSIASLQVRGTTVLKLAAHPSLKWLDLSGCKNIPTALLTELRAKVSRLELAPRNDGSS
jgi:hypothetical protein